MQPSPRPSSYFVDAARSHYLVEPTACTPASGWEKGQVENQVGLVMFVFFAGLAEFERDLIAERVNAGLAAARARGRKGGRRPAITKAGIRRAQAAMQHRDTSVPELCRELSVSKKTALFRYLSPTGELRPMGQKILGMKEGA